MMFIKVDLPLPDAPIIELNEDFLGRVFGVLGMIHSSMMPIVMLIFGPLADIVK